MGTTRYLVTGDLHGRILPAFKLAAAWSRDHGLPLDGVLQVGDLGYFPDPGRLDKATRRHAQKDPLELGALDVVARSKAADAVFADPHAPAALYFTAGNHEDFDALRERGRSCPSQPDFDVDAYGRVRCVRDGRAVALAGGPRVGALWGVDGAGPNRRTKLPAVAYVKDREVDRLSAVPFDVLLTHDGPADAVFEQAGSASIGYLIQAAKPAFAFFGHYSKPGHRIDCDFGPTEVYLLAGFEMRHRGGSAEPGCAGVLTWADGEGRFEFLADDWLRGFTRWNWAGR